MGKTGSNKKKMRALGFCVAATDDGLLKFKESDGNNYIMVAPFWSIWNSKEYAAPILFKWYS